MTLDILRAILLKNIESITDITKTQSLYSDEYFLAFAKYINEDVHTDGQIAYLLKAVRDMETECSNVLLQNLGKNIMKSFGF